MLRKSKKLKGATKQATKSDKVVIVPETSLDVDPMPVTIEERPKRKRTLTLKARDHDGIDPDPSEDVDDICVNEVQDPVHDQEYISISGLSSLDSDDSLPLSATSEIIAESVVKLPKKRGRPAKVPALAADACIIFTVPSGTSKSSDRLTLPLSTTFDDAIGQIYKIIGCQTMIEKPVLSYKIKGVTPRNGLTLRNQEHWDGLIDDVKSVAIKEAKVPCEITLDKGILDAIRGLKDTAGLKTSGARSQGKKAKINLEGLDADADEASILRKKELDTFVRLRQSLSDCPIHSKKAQLCMVNGNSAHVIFDTFKVKAWAMAIAMGDRSVNFATPPHLPLFNDFWKKKSNNNGISSGAESGDEVQPPLPRSKQAKKVPATTAVLGQTVPDNQALLMNAIVTATTIANVLGRPYQHTQFTPLLVDPAQVPIKCQYPDVEDFFLRLMEEYPKRKLGQFIKMLTDQDFFSINELEGKTETFFEKEPYNLSQGNATFVVAQIKEGLANIRRGVV